MLSKLFEGFPPIQPIIIQEVLERYPVAVTDVPPWNDERSLTFTAKLSRDFSRPGFEDIHAIACRADDGDFSVEGEGKEESVIDEDGNERCSKQAEDRLMFHEPEHEASSSSILVCHNLIVGPMVLIDNIT